MICDEMRTTGEDDEPERVLAAIKLQAQHAQVMMVMVMTKFMKMMEVVVMMMMHHRW